MYDVAFGFMPRMFEPEGEDRIIYDEEEEVTEMYFVQDGVINVCYSLIANGITNKQYSKGKTLNSIMNSHVIIGDHYVVNDCKSQFIYMAQVKQMTAFALKKKFLQERVLIKYPDITKILQEDCARLYKK